MRLTKKVCPNKYELGGYDVENDARLQSLLSTGYWKKMLVFLMWIIFHQAILIIEKRHSNPGWRPNR